MRDENASRLVYDWSTSTNCGMNMPFLHRSKTFNYQQVACFQVDYVLFEKLPGELPRDENRQDQDTLDTALTRDPCLHGPITLLPNPPPQQPRSP